MQRITFTADERLIEAARERARGDYTTLDALFRRWLADYVGEDRRSAVALAVIDEIGSKWGGRAVKFTREEMNERG